MMPNEDVTKRDDQNKENVSVHILQEDAKKSTVAIEILYFLCEKCEKTRRNEKDFEISGNLKNCFTTAKMVL